jgi:hypothetical protein
MARRKLSFALTLGALIALAAASSTLLVSCSSRLGWGVVLWTAPEGPLPAGAIVPVYIKSNIQKVYVVGVPGSKERGKKIELPFWQIRLFSSRGKAQSFVKSLGENVGLYMVAVRDGLPLRERPANTARRVYRLREGQSVKILEKVPGEDVSTGGEALKGSWYSVLADDGSMGYAFSYAFRVYDEVKEGPPVLASDKKSLSGRADLIFSRTWRPEYFQEMLDDGRVDLDYFSLRYGIFVDAIRRQVRLELPGASKVFNYADLSEAKGLYVFEGSTLRIKIESDARITCFWSGEVPAAEQEAAAGDEASADVDAERADAVAASQAETPPSASENYARSGAKGSASFVVLSTEPQEAIRAEVLRRQKLLAAFADSGGEWGSLASSSGEGRLSVGKNGRFTWKNRGEAAGDLLPEGLGQSGEAAIRLYLAPSLGSAWEGVLSLRFDPSADSPSAGGSSSRAWIDFLYRHSPAGLVLAPAAPPSALVVGAQDGKAGSLVLEPADK